MKETIDINIGVICYEDFVVMTHDDYEKILEALNTLLKEDHKLNMFYHCETCPEERRQECKRYQTRKPTH